LSREQEEIKVLRGVVYMTKSSRPRTEPWETPHEDVYQEDRSVSHFTRNEGRVIKMSWPIVSKAAERLSRKRHDTYCDPITLTR